MLFYEIPFGVRSKHPYIESKTAHRTQKFSFAPRPLRRTENWSVYSSACREIVHFRWWWCCLPLENILRAPMMVLFAVAASTWGHRHRHVFLLSPSLTDFLDSVNSSVVFGHSQYPYSIYCVHPLKIILPAPMVMSSVKYRQSPRCQET